MADRHEVRQNFRRAGVLAEKIARLTAGDAPRVVDLFSGCGGLSQGFLEAGCVSLAGIETDPDAASSYAANFHQGLPRYARTHFSSEPFSITMATIDLDVAGMTTPTSGNLSAGRKMRELVSLMSQEMQTV